MGRVSRNVKREWARNGKPGALKVWAFAPGFTGAFAHTVNMWFVNKRLASRRKPRRPLLPPFATPERGTVRELLKLADVRIAETRYRVEAMKRSAEATGVV